MHMGTLSVCTSAYQKIVSDSCELPCAFWELNTGPLGEQWILLTTESSFQPAKDCILKMANFCYLEDSVLAPETYFCSRHPQCSLCPATQEMLPSHKTSADSLVILLLPVSPSLRLPVWPWVSERMCANEVCRAGPSWVCWAHWTGPARTPSDTQSRTQLCKQVHPPSATDGWGEGHWLDSWFLNFWETLHVMMRILNTNIFCCCCFCFLKIRKEVLSEPDISMHEFNICILNNKCYYFKKYVSD